PITPSFGPSRKSGNQFCCAAQRKLPVIVSLPDGVGTGLTMRRREFIKLLSGVAATLPLGALAQQREPLRRVAVLEPITKDTAGAQARYRAFLEAFDQLGWTDGRNVQ